MTEFQTRGILLSFVFVLLFYSFQPMQVENPNFELFGGHAPRTS